ncbi:MAG: hypothetical protein V2A61_07550 [Calditrichota bacterium]
MQRFALILAVIGLALVSIPASYAVVRNVPQDYQTIQAAIDAAEEGETALVQI